MKLGLVVVLLAVGFFMVACGSADEVRNGSGGVTVETVEVTQEVTVEKTVTVEDRGSESTSARPSASRTTRSDPNVEGGITREALPGPALPADTEIVRTVGQTATLDNGNSVTVFSGQSGVPSRESVYEARTGMDFFVIEAEVCVPESAPEPSYFTPREFSLLNDDTVRRMASVPTKLPALRGATVEPGECNRGYITFEVEEGEEPRAVAYEGSSLVEWELREN